MLSSMFVALHCIALHCIALHCIALHCIALHCIALHCIALHCIALHCIVLHYISVCVTISLPLQFVLLFAWIDYSPAHYGDVYFPAWADAMGWMMTFASIIWIPVMAAYLLCREDGSLREVSPCHTSPCSHRSQSSGIFRTSWEGHWVVTAPFGVGDTYL